MANRKLTQNALLEFTEMMTVLLESGLSLQDALEICAHTDTTGLSKGLLTAIEKGASFSAALNSLGVDVPLIYQAMIRVGDSIGSVEKIFPRLQTYLREKRKIREKVTSALLYPGLVLSLAFIGVLALTFFIMPQMESMFSVFGGDSSAEIQRNMQAIKTAIGSGTVMLCIIGLCIPCIKLLRKKIDAVDSAIDTMLLRLPLIGNWLGAWEALNFSFSMEILCAGGIPLDLSLGEASGALSNQAWKQGLTRIKRRVENGGSLSRAFLQESIFPAYLTRWIISGEKSGRSETVFGQIRSYYQREVENGTEKLLLLIEPVITAITGLVIMAIVASVLLPLFSAYGNIF
jgi:type II secretory pathway component PulF